MLTLQHIQYEMERFFIANPIEHMYSTKWGEFPASPTAHTVRNGEIFQLALQHIQYEMQRFSCLPPTAHVVQSL